MKTAIICILSAVLFLDARPLSGGVAPTPPPRPVQRILAVPDSTLSPDRRFGVTVPDAAAYDAARRESDGRQTAFLNRLVEVGTGRVLSEIKAENGMERMNHGGISPQWSADGSVLLWVVVGKWFPRAVVVLKLDADEVTWQTDVLALSQQEMLRRVRAEVPKTYAAAVEENKGSGYAFPEGFTIDTILPKGRPRLPYRFTVKLTSNPKAIETFPLRAELFAKMNGELGRDGRIRWSGFKVSRGGEARRLNTSE
ncbi:MAG: hypothetical protein RL088_1680 [Verrucomicrobiota bacterium]